MKLPVPYTSVRPRNAGTTPRMRVATTTGAAKMASSHR